MDNKITIKNMGSCTLVIASQEMGFRRSLDPGSTVMVPEEVFNQLSFDDGFQRLAAAGYFKISGLTEENVGAVEVPKDDAIADIAVIKKMLTDHKVAEFKKFIAKASPAAKETVVKLAIELNITDPAFTAPISKYCGVDVIDAITMARQAAE